VEQREAGQKSSSIAGDGGGPYVGVAYVLLDRYPVSPPVLQPDAYWTRRPPSSTPADAGLLPPAFPDAMGPGGPAKSTRKPRAGGRLHQAGAGRGDEHLSTVNDA
jgi:hypothetical protein